MTAPVPPSDQGGPFDVPITEADERLLDRVMTGRAPVQPPAPDPDETRARTHDDNGCFALNCDLDHAAVRDEVSEALFARLADNEEWAYGLILAVIHRHSFHDHDCQTTMCTARFIWNSYEMTQLLADAYERGAKNGPMPAPVPPATTGGTDEAEGLADWLRDWRLTHCEHHIDMDREHCCAPCLRDRLLASEQGRASR